jgi:glycosyltransferase involved in cell wall biosynthesis
VRLRSVGEFSELYDGAERVTHPAGGGPLGKVLRASPSLRKALMADARAGRILHAHGLWLMPNVYPAWVKQGSGGSVSIVHSPRGMLGRAALKISACKKRPFWRLLQRSALEAADCLHATAPSEHEEIRISGLTNPVAIIPNGIDLPNLDAIPRSKGHDRVALSLGRIHPKKGLDRLVRAWAQIEHEFPSWSLRIIGPAEISHDKELRCMAQSLGAERISIEGAVYGEAKAIAYCSADLFVLPTLSENFAITVAESLAAKVPVVSTKGAPWAGLETERCGWWIDHGVEPLAAALRTAMAMPREELHTMGARGRAWMARDFSWDRIARHMLDVYVWLKVGGEPPGTVRFA